MSVQNKVVIITGASSGIGATLAHELGQAGAKLVLAARRAEKLETIAEQYTDTLVVPTDVTDESACENLIEQTIDKFGRIDILVNNAGITMSATFEEIEDLSLFHKIMNVNYFGSVYCTYYALPHIKKTNGLIVAVSSVTGKTGVPTRTGYSASKHAMQGFFDSLRVELMDTGVDVTVISPGFVQSEIRYNALKEDAQSRNQTHIDEDSVMTAEDCARQMHEAIVKRKRDVIISDSLSSKFVPLLRAIAPQLVDNTARKAIEEGNA